MTFGILGALEVKKKKIETKDNLWETLSTKGKSFRNKLWRESFVHG